MICCLLLYSSPFKVGSTLKGKNLPTYTQHTFYETTNSLKLIPKILPGKTVTIHVSSFLFKYEIPVCARRPETSGEEVYLTADHISQVIILKQNDSNTFEKAKQNRLVCFSSNIE